MQNLAQQLSEKFDENYDTLAEEQVEIISKWFEKLISRGVSKLEINYDNETRKELYYWMPYSDKTIQLLREAGFKVNKNTHYITVFLPTTKDKCEEKKISEEDRTYQSKPQSIKSLQNDTQNSNILYHLYRVATLEGIYIAALVWIFNPGPWLMLSLSMIPTFAYCSYLSIKNSKDKKKKLRVEELKEQEPEWDKIIEEHDRETKNETLSVHSK